MSGSSQPFDPRAAAECQQAPKPYDRLEELASWDPSTHVLTTDLTVEQKPNLLRWIVILITEGLEGVSRQIQRTDASEVAKKVTDWLSGNEQVFREAKNDQFQDWVDGNLTQLRGRLDSYQMFHHDPKKGFIFAKAICVIDKVVPQTKLLESVETINRHERIVDICGYEADLLIRRGLSRAEFGEIMAKEGPLEELYFDLVVNAEIYRMGQRKTPPPKIHKDNRSLVNGWMNVYGGLVVQEAAYLTGRFAERIVGIEAQDVAKTLKARYQELFGHPPPPFDTNGDAPTPVYPRMGDSIVIGPTLAEKVKELAETELSTAWIDSNLEFQKKTWRRRIKYVFSLPHRNFEMSWVASGIVEFVRDNEEELMAHREDLKKFAENLTEFASGNPKYKRTLRPAIAALTSPNLGKNRLGAIALLERRFNRAPS